MWGWGVGWDRVTRWHVVGAVVNAVLGYLIVTFVFGLAASWWDPLLTFVYCLGVDAWRLVRHEVLVLQAEEAMARETHRRRARRRPIQVHAPARAH